MPNEPYYRKVKTRSTWGDKENFGKRGDHHRYSTPTQTEDNRLRPASDPQGQQTIAFRSEQELIALNKDKKPLLIRPLTEGSFIFWSGLAFFIIFRAVDQAQTKLAILVLTENL